MEFSVTIVDQPAIMATRRDSPESARNPQQASGKRNQNGFHQELTQHVALARADRAPHADLMRPLEDAGQHDVHDADPAHEQRNRCDRNHDHFEDVLRPFLFGKQFGGNDHAEVVLISMRRIQNTAHNVANDADVCSRVELKINAVNFISQGGVGSCSHRAGKSRCRSAYRSDCSNPLS